MLYEGKQSKGDSFSLVQGFLGLSLDGLNQSKRHVSKAFRDAERQGEEVRVFGHRVEKQKTPLSTPTLSDVELQRIREGFSFLKT